MSDTAMAGVARQLADALHVFARERRPDDKRLIAELQTRLCAVRREDLEEANGHQTDQA